MSAKSRGAVNQEERSSRKGAGNSSLRRLMASLTTVINSVKSSSGRKQRPPVAPDGYDDLIGDGKRLRFLMADLPSGPLKQARDELLRRMPIMGEGAIRAEIDRISALKAGGEGCSTDDGFATPS